MFTFIRIKKMDRVGFLFLFCLFGAGKGNSFECPSPGGAFAHPELCDWFYRCIENVPTLEQCPKDQLFDLAYSGCNWDYLVECQDRIPPPEPTPAPGDDFVCPIPGGAFPHPDLCDYYYLCQESVPKLEQCPADQLFDLTYSGCNWYNMVDCGDRLPPFPNPTEEPGHTETPGDFECPTPGGAFPHPEFCKQYYLCVQNVPSLKDCPDRQLFDLTYDGCNWEDYVDCQDRERPTNSPSVPTPTTTTGRPGGPTEAPGDYECPAADGLFPNPKDCTSFYNCANSIPTLSHCSTGLHFDDQILVCNYPANVECGDRPIPSSN